MTIPLPLGTSRPIFLSQDDFYEFEGLWEGSLKQPDFAVLWKHGRNEFIINTIVEVGCSQTRESLLACRDTYLEGVPSLSRFISLNVIENPRYAAPKKIELDIAKLKNIDNSTIQVDSIEGPIRYEGIQWVGKNTFSWEVWERNAIDGKPQRVFAAAFDPDDNEGRQLPFFEIPTTIAADIEGITITPADLQLFWEDFLDSAVVREAKRRMINYMRHEMKRRKNEEDTLKAKNDAATKKQIANMERSERHRCRSEREH